MQEVLSFEEACQILRLAKPTLYGYVRRGEIPAFKLGRSWKFHKDSLEQWMRERVQQQTQERLRRKSK
jgi:excisionase family DNA binding protein